MHEECTHLELAGAVTPGALVCRLCEEEGDAWAQLRMCLVCGHVGCCDSSWGRHARQHFEETGHPLMKSIEPGHEWSWCYVHKVFFYTPELEAS